MTRELLTSSIPHQWLLVIQRPTCLQQEFSHEPSGLRE